MGPPITTDDPIMKYPYLPEGRTIKQVGLENEFMREAKRLRDELSKERNYPTGAVVVMNGAIIGRNVNEPPLKSPKLQALHKAGWCVRQWFKIPSGQKYWLCPGCAKSKFHAETRAIKDALKRTKSIAGADLYLYGHWWCCKPCWDNMIRAGIRDVYLVEGAFGLFEKRSYMTAEFSGAAQSPAKQ